MATLLFFSAVRDLANARHLVFAPWGGILDYDAAKKVVGTITRAALLGSLLDAEEADAK
jgi:hypothetical protein